MPRSSVTEPCFNDVNAYNFPDGNEEKLRLLKKCISVQEKDQLKQILSCTLSGSGFPFFHVLSEENNYKFFNPKFYEQLDPGFSCTCVIALIAYII